MLCFLCGKKIGFWRSLADGQYCSNDHRQEARLASAQAMRDEEDEETWANARSRGKAAARKGRGSAGRTASKLAFLGVAVLVIAAFMLPGPQGSFSSNPVVSAQRSAKQGIIERAGDSVGDMLRGVAPVTLHHSFTGGSLGSAASTLTDWASVNLRVNSSGSGRFENHDFISGAQATLRLWKRSTIMQNYQMEFQGQLEKTTLSWAVRASDGGNYFATKLVILKPGSVPNAGVIRYAMVNGREVDRLQLNLPFSIKAGVDYHIRVNVQDDKLVTYLNDQHISSYTDFDKHLIRGGVGFFEDPNEPQKVAWVTVSERDSFLGRMLAHFSMFVLPGQPLQLLP
ncbi:MAG: hypothetical protein ABI824_06935 [Acidobacteriota bacterium]